MYGLTRARIQHGYSILEDATRAVCIPPFDESSSAGTCNNPEREFKEEKQKNVLTTFFLFHFLFVLRSKKIWFNVLQSTTKYK